MKLHVSRQTTRVASSKGAIFARKWFFAGMSSHVLLEISGECTNFSTNCTGILMVVNRFMVFLMSLILGSVGEDLVACRTAEIIGGI